MGLLSAILMICALIINEISGLEHHSGDVFWCGYGHVDSTVKTKFNDDSLCPSEACTQANDAGVMWLVFGSIGVFMSFGTLLVLKVKKSLSCIPLLLAAVLYSLAIAFWLMDNELCWNDTSGEIGVSIWLAMVAAALALAGCILSIWVASTSNSEEEDE